MNDFVERNRLWARLNAAVANHPDHLPTPIAVVDLDAFDANAADLARRAAGKPIRVASKSLRVPALLERALARPGFEGVLSYTLREALVLHDLGITDDLVVAYPTVDRGALQDLVHSPAAAAAVTLMVDDVAHLDVIDSVRSSKAVPIKVALDIDAGLRLGNQHVGPKRSPLYDASAVVALARTVVARDGFRLVGVMTYEGQVAGVPGRRAHPARQVDGRASAQAGLGRAARRTPAGDRRRAGLDRRPGVLERRGLRLRGVHGRRLRGHRGGRRVGSARARSLRPLPVLLPRPAAFFGVRVSRKPSPMLATVHGGGLVASGPAGADRLPLPWAPPGLHLLGLEGAGEVQTPLTGHPAAMLSIGDLVWFRHAKSGELFEHVPNAHLVSGEEIVETVPSYRGLGHAF